MEKKKTQLAAIDQLPGPLSLAYYSVSAVSLPEWQHFCIHMPKLLSHYWSLLIEGVSETPLDNILLNGSYTYTYSEVMLVRP